MNPDRARDLLDRWARNDAMRDKVVIRAYQAGVSKREIHVRTGIARTTIDRILWRHIPDLFSPRQLGIVAPPVSRETPADDPGQDDEPMALTGRA